ncbi:hypothetical protein CHS0354_017770 [Potamilus streckersoni]|uniref:Rab-like protein 6 n=1 Tax=Potamilus streckersoni TaxID=2493646 RepID=A0AAE0WA48_9BIVA|nr:hypothetical protein CHS0354_017770 [Potamilus streckersoni]
MSLFRKFLGSNQQEGGAGKGPVVRGTPPPGHQSMGAQLQRKFAKGVQYNMKIVIKGDRNVGKTCLFLRLQGQKFVEEYLPTDEIQVASIHWNYKTTDDVVKVEVWDVVDKGRKRKKLDGLKIDHGELEEDQQELCLDAEFIDVYKGTQGVILVYDITKQWTFTYVEREIEKIPTHIPILVLGNHRDMGHHRTVLEDKAHYFVRHLERPEGAAHVRYAESSMRNSFGLKYIHKFLNLPFLQLQKETLQKQLELNAEDMASTVEELDILEESEEQNYDVFIEALSSKRREQQEKVSQKTEDQPGKQETQSQSKPNSLPLNVPRSVSAPAIPKATTAVEATSPEPTLSPTQQHAPVSSPFLETQTNNKTKTKVEEKQEQKQGLFSRIFRNKPTSGPQKSSLPTGGDGDHGGLNTAPVQNVEDFVPDGGELDASFLDDAKDTSDSTKPGTRKNLDSDR